MKRLQTDILVIGGGAAGMAAAAAAAAQGAVVLLVDERPYLGGILPQCIHKGFGNGYYGEDLTGPKYSEREIQRFNDSGASYLPCTHVTSIKIDRTALLSGPEGLFECSFGECVLATGCREKTLYSLAISGTRPSGIFTAGEAQEMLNLGQGRDYGIGNQIVILGSGDIGQIMARRLTITGRTVIAMAEISDHLGGMKRNQRECLEAYQIPVILRSTVTEVHGYPHITAVTLRHLDTGEEEKISCDTLITALGLIPETSLADPLIGAGGSANPLIGAGGSADPLIGAGGSANPLIGAGGSADPLRGTDGMADPLREAGRYPSWLHLCGNADHVHEIVDSVTAECYKLGQTLGRPHVRTAKEL